MRTPEAGAGSWASTLRYRVEGDGRGGEQGRWFLCTAVFARYRPQMDVSRAWPGVSHLLACLHVVSFLSPLLEKDNLLNAECGEAILTRVALKAERKGLQFDVEVLNSQMN